MTRESNRPIDDEDALCEVDLEGTGRELTPLAQQFIEAGRASFKTVDEFGFVPSNYEMLWSKLDALPRGKFCELGSGFGIATGLAEILGFEAQGVEISPELVQASQTLLAKFGLLARIKCGDLLQWREQADVFFVYSWPGQVADIERMFAAIASPQTRLLICYGQDDMRCKMLRPNA
ncbi:class I SAM-dependent methyltransferase [Planctomycetes bacterium CA13]